MAHTNITRSSDADGTYALQAVDAVNGNKFLNSGNEVLYIYNPSSSNFTCTIDTTGTLDGNVVADLGISGTTSKRVHRLQPSVYNQQSGSDQGYVYLAWTGTTTGVLVGVFS